MSEWNMLVKQIFDKNRLKNKAYRLGDAMRDAKKVYKKTAKKIMNMSFDRKHKGRRTRGRRHRGRRHRGGEGDAVDEGEPTSEKKGLFSGLF